MTKSPPLANVSIPGPLAVLIENIDMKNYAYNLFPLALVILGYIFIGFSIYSATFAIDYSALEESSGRIVGMVGFLGIGLLLVTFRTRFFVDEKRLLILKEYRVFGRSLSTDKIKIPKEADRILIVPKKKRGKGYINGVVPFEYDLNSYDVYFGLKNSSVPIIKTGRRRAIKIAEFIKSVTQIDYSIKNNYDSQH